MDANVGGGGGAGSTRIVALITAAGMSRRFGSPKLLAPFQGRPLIRATTENVLQTPGLAEVVVVLGFNGDAVREALAGMPVRFVVNDAPERGLGRSIAGGARALDAATDAVVVLLGDQPSVPPAVIRAVIEQFGRTGGPIVATDWAGVRAPPVLFAREIFPELVALDGDSGARPVLDRQPERVQLVRADAPRPLDIDTAADIPN